MIGRFLCLGFLMTSATPTMAEDIDARVVFEHRCAVCHKAGSPGHAALAYRLGAEKALLLDRTDLNADYIRAVVRNGLNAMIPLNRVELTDAELEVVANMLAGQD